MHGLIARASVGIDAPPREVWDALIDPDRVEQYMFGTRVVTDWDVGGLVVALRQGDGCAHATGCEVDGNGVVVLRTVGLPA